MLKKMYDLQKKKGKKGFSMIELIIVIAIMAILIALIGTQLIPYLEKSREKRDMTTLDTIMTAAQSVVSENEIELTEDKKVSELFDGDAMNSFESYAGMKSTDQPFKSAKAKKTATVGDVTINVTKKEGSAAVITGVTINDLEVTRNITSSK